MKHRPCSSSTNLRKSDEPHPDHEHVDLGFSGRWDAEHLSNAISANLPSLTQRWHIVPADHGMFDRTLLHVLVRKPQRVTEAIVRTTDRCAEGSKDSSGFFDELAPHLHGSPIWRSTAHALGA